MKVKVLRGNMVYRGQVYTRGACIEIMDGEYDGLSQFVAPCDCGCGHTEVSSIQTQEFAPKKKLKKKKKDCKTC